MTTPDSAALTRRLACSISPESSEQDVADALFQVDQLGREVKEIKAILTEQLLEYLEEHGELTVGEVRYYAGKKKRIKVRDREALVDAVLTATGGDLTAFADAMAATPFKQGTIKVLVGQDAWDALYEVEELADLKTGKPKKEVKQINPKFQRTLAGAA